MISIHAKLFQSIGCKWMPNSSSWVLSFCTWIHKSICWSTDWVSWCKQVCANCEFCRGFWSSETSPFIEYLLALASVYRFFNSLQWILQLQFCISKSFCCMFVLWFASFVEFHGATAKWLIYLFELVTNCFELILLYGYGKLLQYKCNVVTVS